MIRLLSVSILLLLNLYALSNEELLNRAHEYMNSSSKSDKFRAYNDYKNLYLKTLMDDDKQLKKESLKGIVESGNALHIDVSQYEDELLEFESKDEKKDFSADLTAQESEPKQNNNKVQIISSHKLKNISWIDEDRLLLKLDKKISDIELKLTQGEYILQVGKRKFAKLKVN